MNKLIFGIFMFACSFSLAVENFQSEFSTINNLGFKTKHLLKIEKSNIYFDSEKIDRLQLPLIISSLKALSNTVSDETLYCTAGTYTHKVIKDKIRSQNKGCLNSKRANQLLLAIERFKKTKLQ